MVLPNLLALVLSMILIRVLLKPGMDDYNIVVTYPAMFAAISDLGLTGVVVRDIARNKSKMPQYFGSFFALRIGTSLLMSGISVTILQFMPYSLTIKNFIYVTILAQLIFQVAQAFSTIFQAAERMEYVTYGIILQSVSYFGLSLYFLSLGMGIQGIVYASVISNVIMLAAYMLMTQKRITRVRFDIDPALLKYMLVSTLPFAIYAVFNVLSSYFDKFLISVLRSGELSNYTQPYSLVAALSFISTAYVASVFPLFAKISGKNNGSVRYACEKSIKYLFALMLPICVGTTLLSERIIFTLWPWLPGGIPVLCILIWTTLIVALNAVGSTLLNASHRERANTINLGFTVLLSAALNLVVIPWYGAIGSALVCAFTLSVYMLLTLYLIRDDIKGIKVMGSIARIAVASIAMAVVIVLFPLNNLFLYVACGAVVYAVAFILVGGVARDDIQLAKKILFGGPGDKGNNSLTQS